MPGGNEKQELSQLRQLAGVGACHSYVVEGLCQFNRECAISAAYIEHLHIIGVQNTVQARLLERPDDSQLHIEHFRQLFITLEPVLTVGWR